MRIGRTVFRVGNEPMQTAKRILWVLWLLNLPAASSRGEDFHEGPAACACEAPVSCLCSVCSSGQRDDGHSWKLFGDGNCLERWGITLGGHLDQGITTNSRNPTNPPAGVGNAPATQNNYRND